MAEETMADVVNEFVGVDVSRDEFLEVMEETSELAVELANMLTHWLDITEVKEDNPSGIAVEGLRIGYTIGYLRGKYEVDRKYLCRG